MIPVKKGAEPAKLKTLREEAALKKLSPESAYDTLKNPEKREVLEALKRDQGQLCVYCMCRIPRSDKSPGIAGETIEHFIPLDRDDGRDIGQGLDYNNLFAVCHGNVRARKKGERRVNSMKTMTCDKHRQNTEFRKINPCNAESLQSISYSMDGRITASDTDVLYDLTKTLNLNCEASPLIGERKAALDSLVEEIGKIGNEPTEKLHSFCDMMLKGFLSETNPKTPYAGVLIWYLQDMLNKLGKMLISDDGIC